MKKRMMALLLAAGMVLGLTACGGPSPAESLQGEWDVPMDISASDWEEDLVNMGFYEDEIALIDTEGLAFVRSLTFNADGTYSDEMNEAKSRDNIKSTATQLFEVLYENRSSIEEYAGFFDDLGSVEEFIDGYATNFFDFESGDAMLSDMVDYVYSLYSMENETGEFKADSSQIGFKAEGEDDYSYADYKLDGDELTVTYADGVETFTRQ